MRNLLVNLKNKKSSLILILGCVLLMKSLFPKPNVTGMISVLRRETSSKIDSVNKIIEAENKSFDYIQHLISSGNLEKANQLIDPVLKKNPRNDFYHIFKGQVYDARKQYDSALFEYNLAIAINETPLALDKRAKTFLKLGKVEQAITDYRTACDRNFDYSYQLALIFEKIGQNDSALKYYTIFDDHYPDSNIKKRIEFLQK
jgi:tetratricopeptide (TPR) repeat protein